MTENRLNVTRTNKAAIIAVACPRCSSSANLAVSERVEHLHRVDSIENGTVYVLYNDGDSQGLGAWVCLTCHIEFASPDPDVDIEFL